MRLRWWLVSTVGSVVVLAAKGAAQAPDAHTGVVHAGMGVSHVSAARFGALAPHVWAGTRLRELSDRTALRADILARFRRGAGLGPCFVGPCTRGSSSLTLYGGSVALTRKLGATAPGLRSYLIGGLGAHSLGVVTRYDPVATDCSNFPAYCPTPQPGEPTVRVVRRSWITVAAPVLGGGGEGRVGRLPFVIEARWEPSITRGSMDALSVSFGAKL